MDCELCGRQDYLVNAIVEGSSMKVCQICARYGHVIALEKLPETEKPKPKPRLELPSELIVDDYGSIIKNAREQLKFTQEELAAKIAEKESIIHKLESYYLAPTIELARKLEEFLKIKLVYTQQETAEKKIINIKDDSMTIGDIIKMRRK